MKKSAPSPADELDRKEGFKDALKNGRDTRPERAWDMMAQYVINKEYDRPDLPVFNHFGAVVYGILRRWPTAEDFRPDSVAAEILAKGWMKTLDGVIREPRGKYSPLRDSFSIVFSVYMREHIRERSSALLVLEQFSSLRDEFERFER
jgi:hypothetical protein